MNQALRCIALAVMAATLTMPTMARQHGHGHRHHPSGQGSGTGSSGSHNVAGQFDYYVMSLSWSPTYCLTHASDTAQCGGSKGFGFVLHGLWPQYARGGYPADCATPQRLTPEAIAEGQKVFPSANLISHEWGKHGTCSGMSALDYFKTADQAHVSIHVPAAMDAPSHTLQMTAKDIAAAFLQANGGMPGSALAVVCSGPELQEVRVCMDKSLHVQACGADVKSSCRPGPIRVPAVH